VSKKYKLAELSGYDSIDPIINADDVEELIYDKVISDKKFITLLAGMSEEEKIALFMEVVRSVEWMLGESELMKDLVEEALYESYYNFMAQDGEEGE